MKRALSISLIPALTLVGVVALTRGSGVDSTADVARDDPTPPPGALRAVPKRLLERGDLTADQTATDAADTRPASPLQRIRLGVQDGGRTRLVLETARLPGLAQVMERGSGRVVEVFLPSGNVVLDPSLIAAPAGVIRDIGVDNGRVQISVADSATLDGYFEIAPETEDQPHRIVIDFDIERRRLPAAKPSAPVARTRDEAVEQVVSVSRIRLGQHRSGHTRIVFEADLEPDYEIGLRNEENTVLGISIDSVELAGPPEMLEQSLGVVDGITLRNGTFRARLNTPSRLLRHFVLAPSENNPRFRLVVDVEPLAIEPAPANRLAQDTAKSGRVVPESKRATSPPAPTPAPAGDNTSRAVVIRLPVRVPDVEQREARARIAFGASDDAEFALQKSDIAFVLGRVKSEYTADLSRDEEFVTFAELRAIGMDVVYDPSTVRVDIRLPPGIQRPQRLSHSEYVPPSPDSYTEPATISAYANAFSALNWIEDIADGESTFSLNSTIDSSVSLGGFRGVVLMSRFVANATEEESRFSRGPVRLVKDHYEKAIRTQIGDLSLAPISAAPSQGLAGIAIERRYAELQPSRSLRPGTEQRISVEEPSTVRIIVNGAEVNSLRLPPGEYTLDDFPVFSGANDITLVIEGDSGRRREVPFSVFSDSNLLEKGLSEFSLAVGVPRFTNEDGGVDYEEEWYAGFSGQYGVTDNLTARFDAQANEFVQEGGVGAVAATPFGTFDGEIRLSQSGGDNGWAGDVQYRTEVAHLPVANSPLFVSAVAGGNSDGYSTPFNEDFREQSFGSLQLSQQIAKASLGLGYRQDRLEGETVSEGINLSVNRSFGGLALGFNYAHAIDGDLDDRLYLSLSSRLTPRQAVRATHDTRAETTSLSWSRSRGREENSVGQALRLRMENDGSARAAGTLSLSGSRVDLRASSGLVTDETGTLTAQTTGVSVAAAIVHADGATAITSPVNDAFAIVRPHKALKGAKISVGRGGDRPESTSGPLGPAVVSNLRAYDGTVVSVRPQDLPDGYVLRDTSFSVLPGLGAGYKVTVGDGKLYSAFGTLVDSGGEPLPFAGGQVIGADGSTQHFFTNGAGRFFVIGLVPGAYDIRLFGDGGLFRFNVEETDILAQDVGEVPPDGANE